MSSWHGYPKIYALGHAYLKDLLLDPVVVQEKIDGSQFSFGRFGTELKMRSKGQELIPGKEKMFAKAEETVMTLFDKLQDGWTYRGEYLQKPKHNVLAYDRTPVKNIILFDINTGEEGYLAPEQVQAEANKLGLEVVPTYYLTQIASIADFETLLELTSVLGGQKIEGFVVKNYSRFGKDGKALMGKFVSENFKEKHKVDWKEGNPLQNDIIAKLIATYRTPARWDKSVIHLKERGLIEGSPKDIGLLIQEVGKNVMEEVSGEMLETLWKWAQPKVMRGLVAGLPEYYKKKLMESQFETVPPADKAEAS